GSSRFRGRPVVRTGRRLARTARPARTLHRTTSRPGRADTQSWHVVALNVLGGQVEDREQQRQSNSRRLRFDPAEVDGERHERDRDGVNVLANLAAQNLVHGLVLRGGAESDGQVGQCVLYGLVDGGVDLVRVHALHLGEFVDGGLECGNLGEGFTGADGGEAGVLVRFGHLVVFGGGAVVDVVEAACGPGAGGCAAGLGVPVGAVADEGVEGCGFAVAFFGVAGD